MKRSDENPLSAPDPTSPQKSHEMSLHNTLPEDPPYADLVGWAANGRLDVDPSMPDDLSREVLATALGIRVASLSGMDPAAVQNALGRLRALIDQISRLSSAAAVDDLTGALRRSAGVEAMIREIARSRRNAGKGVAVVFIDVDGLKQWNDTQGHAAGDTLLRHVVDALHDRLRAYDLVIRWGGDEFVCVLSNVTEGEARRLVADIEAQVRTTTRGRTISTGLAMLDDEDTAETVVARADATLYAGRDRVRSAR